MEITEIRIKLMEEPSERLRAFCSITFDNAFVVRDLKIIEGTKGAFVAMPSRKLADHCPACRAKNHLRARFCSNCGIKLDENRAAKGADGRARLHADIAHPINSACREQIQTRVLKAFQEELERSKQPGYVPPPDFDDEVLDADETYDSLIDSLSGGDAGPDTRPPREHDRDRDRSGRRRNHRGGRPRGGPSRPQAGSRPPAGQRSGRPADRPRPGPARRRGPAEMPPERAAVPPRDVEPPIESEEVAAGPEPRPEARPRPAEEPAAGPRETRSQPPSAPETSRPEPAAPPGKDDEDEHVFGAGILD